MEYTITILREISSKVEPFTSRRMSALEMARTVQGLRKDIRNVYCYGDDTDHGLYVTQYHGFTHGRLDHIQAMEIVTEELKK